MTSSNPLRLRDDLTRFWESATGNASIEDVLRETHERSIPIARIAAELADGLIGAGTVIPLERDDAITMLTAILEAAERHYAQG